MSRLRVLMYHKVSENGKDFLTVTALQLKEQLIWLKERYSFITLRDLTENIEFGKPLPDDALLITFDDGYENNYTFAYPIFKQLNLPFSIFLVSDFLGKEIHYDNELQKFLGIEQLQQMQDIVQYGYHSFNHHSLMDVQENRWEEEIRQGKESIKTHSITIENAWAYTYGRFPKKNIEKFKKLKSVFSSNKITCAFRIGNRINKLPLSEPYAIQRIDVRGNESFIKFKWKVRIGKMI